MATKLKNINRHWLTKLLAVFLVIFSGLFFIWSSFSHYTAHPDFSFEADFENSSEYNEKLDRYYTKVYDAYYKNPKVVNAALIAELKQENGYYYLIAKSNGDYFSNIDNLNNDTMFYQKIASMVKIDSEQGALNQNGKHYFTQAPPSRDHILVGIDAALLSKENAIYKEQWLKVNSPWFYTSGFCFLGIFLGMIHLAVTSGRKPNSDQIHFHSLDSIFLDVYLALWMLFFSISMAILSDINITDGYLSLFTIIIMIIATINGLFGLLYWTSVSKRIKSRQLFSHTLFGYLTKNTLGYLWRFSKYGFSLIKEGPFYRLPIALSLLFLVINTITIIVGFLLSVSFGFFGFIIGGAFYLSGIGVLAVYLIYQDQQFEQVITALGEIEQGNLDEKISLHGTKQFVRLANLINRISNGFSNAVENEIKAERLKSELLTNVSHDLRTPLTSIINYVDLLKTKGLDAEDAPHYLDVLDQKSQRLYQLTEDLFEASKASSGNLQVTLDSLNLKDFILQATGEFKERFENATLDLRIDLPEEPLMVDADGRHLWRVLENILLNALKYAAPQSRVYLSAAPEGTNVMISLKNVSAEALNIPSHALLERFTRGDLSRGTEGSGLGLSIAKSLTELQKGHFELQIDGDLFRVNMRLPLSKQK